MLIKQQNFHIHIPAKRAPLVIFTGKEAFLMHYFKTCFKKTWQIEAHTTTFKRCDIQKSEHWQQAAAEISHYDLFAEETFLEIYYEKDQLDKDGKLFFEYYLKQQDPNCLIFLYAPNLSPKKLTALVNHQAACLLHLKSPAPQAVIGWIQEQLRSANYHFAPNIPTYIHQNTQGNLLACQQILEKIFLTYPHTTVIDTALLQPYLYDQSIYQLYEFSDTCLLGDTVKALNMLRYLLKNQQEPILILWVLTQEIRLLRQVHDLQTNSQNLSFQAALDRLKIWSTKAMLYKKASQRLNSEFLLTLINTCLKIDNGIKSSSRDVNQNLERLVLAICQGKAL